MNYIYDIYLNFNKELYDFFDWNKSDKITHVKSIPIFKVTEKTIKDIINYDIQFEENYSNYILNKATTWSKCKKNYALFCTEDIVIGLEIDSNGKSIAKSYLNIDEELEILENHAKYKCNNFKYKTLKKAKNYIKTRKQIKDEEFVVQEIKEMDEDKLSYIFFECFGKHKNDKSYIRKALLNLSKKSKTYKNLYNILKLTSTSAK